MPGFRFCDKELQSTSIAKLFLCFSFNSNMFLRNLFKILTSFSNFELNGGRYNFKDDLWCPYRVISSYYLSSYYLSSSSDVDSHPIVLFAIEKKKTEFKELLNVNKLTITV